VLSRLIRARRMRVILLLATALVLAAPAAAHAFTVYGAASLSSAFPVIDSSPTYNFAGSNQLQLQIERGAPADLFASASPAEPAQIRSIAVLPLKNLSGDPTNEYFSDGLTESLITALSKIEGLRVISRSSVFRFKHKETTPEDIGKNLGVAGGFISCPRCPPLVV